MSLPYWREEAIAKQHDRKNFDCGQNDLNIFLAKHARQSHESGSAKTYCAVHDNGKTILGFYTVSPSQIDLAQVPMSARPSGGGRYAVNGYRLGRLAVSKNYQEQGLGARLFALSIERCMKASASVGGTVLFIDAKDDIGVAWYKLYGAIPLHDRPTSLILPYEEYRRAISMK